MELIGYIAAVLIGFTLGLLGGGGSILTIPILVYLFQLDTLVATAYSLFIVGLTSLVGVIPKYRQHLVNFKTGFLFGLPSILSIFITRKWIVAALPETIFTFSNFVVTRRLLLLGLFAILMILAAYSMIKGKKEIAGSAATIRVPLIIAEGIFIGLLTGLVGAGGGFLIIPALVILTGLPMKTATGTSLFIIGINSLIGFTGDLFNLTMDWSFLGMVTSLAIGGIFLGNWASSYVHGDHLRKAFGWFTLVMGVWILLKELFWT